MADKTAASKASACAAPRREAGHVEQVLHRGRHAVQRAGVHDDALARDRLLGGGGHEGRGAFGPVDTGRGARKSWTGILRGFEDGAVLVEADGHLHRIPHGKIAKAHIEFDFEADLRRKE